MSSLSNFIKRLRDIMRNDAGINGDAQRIEQIAWMLFLKVYDAKEEDWNIDEDGKYISIIPENCRWQNWAKDDHSGKAMTGDSLLDFVDNTLFPTLKKLEITPATPIKKMIVKTTFEDANNYMKDGVLLRQVINIIDEIDLGDYEESHAFGEIYESILRELQSAGSSGEFYTPRAVTDFMAKMIKPQIGETIADFACGTGGFLISWLRELEKQIETTGDQEAYDKSIYGIEKKQFPYMLCITNMLLHGIDVPRIYHDNSLLKDILDYTETDRFDVVLMNPPYGGSEKSEVKNHFPSDLASSETADLFMSVIIYRLRKNGRAAVILPDGFLFGTDNAKIAIKKKLFSEFNLHTVIRMPHSVFAPYTSITTNILFFDNTHPTEETWYYRLDMPDGYKNFSKTKPMKLEHFTPVIEWWDNRQELYVDGFDKAKKYTVKEIVDRTYNIDLCGFPHEEEEILPPKELIQQYQEKRASLNADIDRILAQITDILGIDLTEEDDK
ncbi:type I restriction-modification system subunit M [Lacrimispora amygdalina]|uniref:type I restriction-modification system subunit M n=1 Tax=Lacrimispora amygdalina TaxID=253257 RepID=UPI000BE2E981|nr:class I SAM-dependent DNA methyltransferase [Lacrimispora amygdalina]